MLSAQHITAGYGSTMILRDLSILAPKGEVTAVAGRNGTGKTTLVRTIMGYTRMQRGEIRLDGQDIAPLPTAQRARSGIGYVPQGRQLFPDLTVEENLEMGRTVGLAKGERKDLSDRVYSMFPILAERRRQRAGTLSGGQQQMAAIGRALIAGPSVLLLDEPSEGIQPSIVGEIEQHILALKKEIGLTIFVVEQDTRLIKTVADRCFVLDQGRIAQTFEREAFADTDVLEKCLEL